MSVRVNISVNLDTASPVLATLARTLQGDERRDLHAAMGEEVRVETRSYLLKIAGERHATANRLGASPTGHLGRAAESVASPAAVTADASEAVLTISNPGMSRAFRDVEIKPTGGRQWLTIAVLGAAYGRRVREVEQSIGKRLFRPGRKGDKKRVLAAGDGSGGLIIYYALAKAVTQRQDRTLLPSDETWQQAAVRGAARHIQTVVGEVDRSQL